MKNILVTGASGYIASLILPTLKQNYNLTILDNSSKDKTGKSLPGIKVCDLSETDNNQYIDYFSDVDTVIHLAYKRSSPGGVWDNQISQIDKFPIELENIVIANNVYRAAYDNGVKRVVVASSNHAADWYEHSLIHNGIKDMVGPEDYPVSDNFYGWAKASYELLSWPYASGKFGRKLEFIHVRIGAPRDVDVKKDLADPIGTEPAGGGLANFKRNLGAFISERDITQLFLKAVETKDIVDEHGIPYQIVYGCSDNTRRFWSLESAKKILDYNPQDDSEIIYSAQIRKYITDSKSETNPGRVGK